MSVIEYPPKPIHKLKRQQLETVCIALEGMRDEAIRQRDDARAKLAAAEQERDHARAEWHRHNERADHERFLRSRQSEELRRAETALAAVRKAIRAERDRFAQATNWKFVACVKPAVDRIDAAVAAAEQPEPERA